MKFSIEKLKQTKIWNDPKNQQAIIEAVSSRSGGLQNSEREKPAGPLAPRIKARSSNKGGVVICVDIIALNQRFIDDDNICSGAKHLRDCIAASLGLDDGDKCLRWRYGFCQTEGREQTIVRISVK